MVCDIEGDSRGGNAEPHAAAEAQSGHRMACLLYSKVSMNWTRGAAQKFSFVRLQFLREALYLILLSVLYLIQLGRGRFDLIFLA